MISPDVLMVFPDVLKIPQCMEHTLYRVVFPEVTWNIFYHTACPKKLYLILRPYPGAVHFSVTKTLALLDSRNYLQIIWYLMCLLSCPSKLTTTRYFENSVFQETCILCYCLTKISIRAKRSISRVFSLFIVPSPFFVHCPYKGRINRAESVLTGLKPY